MAVYSESFVPKLSLQAVKHKQWRLASNKCSLRPNNPLPESGPDDCSGALATTALPAPEPHAVQRHCRRHCRRHCGADRLASRASAGTSGRQRPGEACGRACALARVIDLRAPAPELPRPRAGRERAPRRGRGAREGDNPRGESHRPREPRRMGRRGEASLALRVARRCAGRLAGPSKRNPPSGT